jgi:mRNA-degrading endonuclease toxin of MazEF toxin-antitoxin module
MPNMTNSDPISQSHLEFNTNTCVPGDVVLVFFPFSDFDKTKKRPALVIKKTPFRGEPNLVDIYEIAMITSQIDTPLISGDMLVLDMQSAGVLHPSRIRLAKSVAIETSAIAKKLGRLSDPDLAKFKATFKEFYRVWL